MQAFKNFFLNDKNILALISINALLIFIQGFPLEMIGSRVQDFCMLIDDFIAVLFLIEVVVKSQHFGLREYLRSNWNKFDVLLIFFSLPPLFLHFAPVTIATNISFLLVFRIFRVFKFFRFIQFFPQVEHIFRSIREAVRASFMVLIGFFVFIFIMSIISCYFYQKIAPQYFSDPITAYYTIFKIFTIEGWNTIPDEIVASGKLNLLGAFLTKFYFATLLVVGGIGGLSIVNSIFVDAMVSDNNDDLEKQVDHMEQEMKVLHSKMDKILTLLEQQTPNNPDQSNSSNV